MVYLAQGFLEQGFKVQVLLSDAGYMDGWAQQLELLGSRVTRAKLKSLSQRKTRFVSAMFDRRQIGLIAKLSAQIQPDAILVNQQYDEDGLDYISGALESGVKRVASVMHMPMTKNKDQRPLGRIRGRCLRMWYARKSFQLIFVSTGARAEFEEYYSLRSTGKVINNAAPQEDLAKALPNTTNARKKRPIIGFFGQFVAQKNLSMLVDAWSILNAKGLPCDLLLVGEGPERQQLETQIANAATSQGSWSIKSWVDNPESLYKEIDIFAMPSLFEGLPLGLIEAAMRGLPCVVAPFNGASDVAQIAPWVYVSTDHQLNSFESSLAKVVEEISMNKVSDLDQTILTAFRKHFSISRMAKEYANAMGTVS